MTARAATPLLMAALVVVCGAVAALDAQPQRGRGGAPEGPPPTAKAQAPAGTLLDLTGYWLTVVTEDWRYRMVTAPKGDHPGSLSRLTFHVESARFRSLPEHR